MSLDDNDSFDIDAGVDSIAADMGWESTDEATDEHTDEAIIDELQGQETETAEKVVEQQPEVTAKAPPASWAKEQHETWSSLTPQAQEYIELREKQMLDGIEQYKQGHAFGSEVARAFEPYRDQLQAHGVNEVQAVSNLLQWNQTLQTGSLEQRQQAFIALGTDLGLIPRDGQPQIDPHTQELQQRLDRIEQQEQQRIQAEQQRHYQQVASEVEAFASDPANAYFDEVADDVIVMLNAGLDLKTAYERAVWANPITRAKEQAKIAEEAARKLTEKNTAEAKAALKAKGANVKPSMVTNKPGAPSGSWDDTMQETLARIRAN